jgi:hypothetical protein
VPPAAAPWHPPGLVDGNPALAAGATASSQEEAADAETDPDDDWPGEYDGAPASLGTSLHDALSVIKRWPSGCGVPLAMQPALLTCPVPRVLRLEQRLMRRR